VAPVNTSSDLFGGNSDGGMRLSEWLEVMCKGCVSNHGRGEPGMAGLGCDLVSRAIGDPYDAGMPEWSTDASPWPQRFAELGDGPWPTCLAYRPRKKRSDAGQRRGQHVPDDQDALF
jgi:hypothetical protein